MLRETNIPSILVEGGFMDSLTDIVSMRDDNKLKAQGEAIAQGVAEFLGLPKKVVVPDEIIGVATLKKDTFSYADTSYSSAKVTLFKAGTKRHIYKIERGWYLLHGGDWLPSDYGKTLTTKQFKKRLFQKKMEMKPSIV